MIFRNADGAHVSNVRFVNIGDGFLDDKRVSSNYVVSVKGTNGATFRDNLFTRVNDAGRQRFRKTSTGWAPIPAGEHLSPRAVYMHNFYVIRSTHNTFRGNVFTKNNCDIKLRDGASDNVFARNVFEKAVGTGYGDVGPFLNSEGSGECESVHNELTGNEVYGNRSCRRHRSLAWTGLDAGRPCGDKRALWVTAVGSSLNVGGSSPQLKSPAAGPRGLCD
jgi:hypothetical protein